MKIKLAILENDSSYLNRITSVFMSKYSDKLEIYSFTDKDVAIKSINDTKINVFLVSDKFEVNSNIIPESCGLAYLVESNDIEMLHNQKAIFKYQKADLIYKQILSLYSENISDDAKLRFNDSDTKFIAFVSASGGVGNTTIAVSYSKFLARRGKSVLFLDLSLTGYCDKFFNGEGQFDFSDLIYSLKSRKSNVGLKIASIIKNDETGLNYISSAKSPLHMNELYKEDIEKLLNEINILGEYEYVIIDLELNFEEKNVYVLDRCDRIVFVSDGSEISNSKFERMYSALKIIEDNRNVNILDKSGIIYNKFSNKLGKTVSGLNIKEFGGIQKFEHAATYQIIQTLLDKTVFNRILD